MDSWVMLVQYVCAAAGAAAVVRWVDGCGKAQKKNRPLGGARKRFSELKRTRFIRARQLYQSREAFARG